MPLLLALFATGLGAGMLGALLGLGGGIFLVPALSLLFHRGARRRGRLESKVEGKQQGLGKQWRKPSWQEMPVRGPWQHLPVDPVKGCGEPGRCNRESHHENSERS